MPNQADLLQTLNEERLLTKGQAEVICELMDKVAWYNSQSWFYRMTHKLELNDD